MYNQNVMEIVNKADLQTCFFNESKVKPAIEIYDTEQEQEEKMNFQKNEIVFIMEGEVRFCFLNQSGKTLRKGAFVFIPVGETLRYTLLKESKVIIVRLNGNVKLCDGYRMEELYAATEKQESSSNREVNALEINSPLSHFLHGLCETVQGGLSCRYYFDIKAKELFVLLKAYYPKEDLRAFFSLILSPDTVFSEYVRTNHHKYKSAKELAEAMYITPKLFSKKFTKIFGEPAIDWLSREKAFSVYSELHTGHEPIVLIADKYGFSSQSHLNKFCKHKFGKSPREIRNKGRMYK